MKQILVITRDPLTWEVLNQRIEEIHPMQILQMEMQGVIFGDEGTYKGTSYDVQLNTPERYTNKVSIKEDEMILIEVTEEIHGASESKNTGNYAVVKRTQLKEYLVESTVEQFPDEDVKEIEAHYVNPTTKFEYMFLENDEYNIMLQRTNVSNKVYQA